jgi:hypothetical protein
MFNVLPGHSKVFIFQADKVLEDKDLNLISKELNIFIPEWAAHGSDLRASFKIIENIFVVVGLDESQARASGCSKDALTRCLKEIGTKINVDFFNRLNSVYLNQDNDVQIVNMLELKSLIKKEEVKVNTKIYNNLIETKNQLESEWLVELQNSWHKTLIS